MLATARGISPSRLASMAMVLRDQLDLKLDMMPDEEAGGLLDLKGRGLPLPDDHTLAAADQIASMLRQDARLSTSEAIKLLVSSLSTAYKVPASLRNPSPKSGKNAFRTWLQSLMRVVPPSVLLHHAAAIRNAAVHSEGSDWPLRYRDE